MVLHAVVVAVWAACCGDWRVLHGVETVAAFELPGLERLDQKAGGLGLRTETIVRGQATVLVLWLRVK